MYQMISYFKRKPHILILIIILSISIFFRTYELAQRYGYGHDAELFSWIAKDIIVNHHTRLIGQLTSAEGIFIGPLFYYSIVPFFILFKMDPIGAVVPITVIGILTTLSYYFVFSKLFSKNAGLIISFLHAILLTWIGFDRRIVPSSPANIWVVWYFYILINIARGNLSVFPVLGILIGLIWHIHIALLPTLFAIPFAFLAARKLPKTKEIIIFFLLLFITFLPLIIFEVRHNFIQTKALIDNFTTDHGGGSGLPKLIYMLSMLKGNIHNLIISPYNLPQALKPFFTAAILSLGIVLFRRKIINSRELIPALALLIGVIGFFTFSSSLVSEYYIYSVEIIFVSLIGLTFALLYKSGGRIGKFFVFSVLGILFVKNLYSFLTADIYKKDYQERKGVVEFITNDAKQKGYPCIGISYITTPGENTGFRYFFYLKNQHLVHPSLEVPVYNIVIPDELSLKEVTKKFGHIGIIPPVNIPSKESIKLACQTPNTNLTDPLFGYVE